MAQHIVTLCDEHLENGEDVAGKTHEIGVRLPGGSWTFYALDVCDVHAKSIVDLSDHVQEFGRAIDASEVAAFKPAQHVCSECGQAYKHRSSLRSHMSSVHQTEVPAAESAERQCPDCDRKFVRAQSLGIHRRYAHGVNGQSREAVRSRQRSDATDADG